MKTEIPQWLAAEVAQYDLDLAEPPRTILDIGANIGAYTLRCKERWPHAIVYAYEPHVATALKFAELCGPLCAVDLKCAAVRSFNGPAEIKLGDHSVTNSFHDLGRQTTSTETVKCIAAATLPGADLIKIDTEGCEVEILGGLNLRETRALVVEYHRAEDVAPIKHLATKAGLELAEEKPLGQTWGILKFARPGALADRALSPARSPMPGVKLFLALPIYRELDAFFTQCLIKLLADPPCTISLRMLPGDSLVSRARNTLTADFLASDCTHLLFLDTDLIFSGEQIARALAHGKSIVGGFYPKKQEGPIQWVCNGCFEEQPIQPDGLQRVRYMGTGFLLITRAVFERMIAAYESQIRYKPDHADRVEHDFWSVGVYEYPDGTRRFLSEDWFFCQRALDLGFEVWGDTQIVLKHVGQAIYPLKSQEADSCAAASRPLHGDRPGTLPPARPVSPSEPEECRAGSGERSASPSALCPLPSPAL